MQPNVSIIVPVYNSEEFIKQTVDSLLAQTMSNIEIILVNDGSQDKSKELLDEYEKKDPRIKVINQENQGIGAARNTGLAAATGIYIGFMDSDDFAEADMYERLYDAGMSNNCDVVISDMKLENYDNRPFQKNIGKLPENVLMNRSDIVDRVCTELITEEISSSVCDKIYLKSFLIENNLCFNKDVKVREDLFFNIDVFNFAKLALFVPSELYHYRNREDSTSRTYYKDTLGMAENIYEYKNKYRELWGINSEGVKNKLLFDFLFDVQCSAKHLFDKRNTDKFFQKTNYVYCIVNDPVVINSIKEYKNLNVKSDKIDSKIINLIGSKSIFLLSLTLNK